jgi:hypothetical protein
LLFAAILSTTLFPACEDDADLTSAGVPTYCLINWSGALATEASVFTVRACWNGRCTNDIAIQATAGDAGTPHLANDVDAGCTKAPTTPGGLPSGCRAARTQEAATATPSATCGNDDIGDEYSVSACARSGTNGEIDFDVQLTPSRPSYPPLGGQAALSIETSMGVPLLSSEARAPSAEGSGAPCQGARFALDGTLLAL